MSVAHYSQEAPMAADTLTTPVIDGSTTKTRVFKNFIDGEWVESVSGRTFEDRNPADTREVVAIFQRSNKADVDAAVDAAKRAFAKWRLVPAPRRAEMVFRAAEILMERKEDRALRVAQQIRHGGSPANRCLRHDHALEFSHGHLFVEAAARRSLRQHLRDQARAGYSALHFQPGAGAHRCRHPERRH